MFFEDLSCVILDEIHTLHASKRGDLLALDLARLQVLAPRMRRVGLSATVDDPEVIKAWMTSHRGVDVIDGGLAPPPSRALRARSTTPEVVPSWAERGHVDPWPGPRRLNPNNRPTGYRSTPGRWCLPYVRVTTNSLQASITFR